MGAPVCNINPASPPPSSKAPALPSIPPASDLASVIAAVNALRQLVIQYFGQIPPGGGGNTYITNPQTPGNPNNPGGGGFGGGNFVERPSGRVMKTTRIYDQNDPSQQTYVDVNQITGLTFGNKSGQTIVWSQD